MAIELKEYNPKPISELSNLGPMYLYGMRLRGFAPGCQPMKGLVGTMEGIERYHCVLIYNRELTDEEVRDYEFDRLEESK